MLDSMELLVDVTAEADGRLTGTVRAPGSADAVAFSGRLEFLASVERLSSTANLQGDDDDE